MTCALRFLSIDEHKAKEAARLEAWQALVASCGGDYDAAYKLPAAAKTQRSNWFEPGDAHFCPWYFDPSDPADAPKRLAQLAKAEAGELPGFLSWHYWRTWSDKRPPINVFLPNGEEWLIDQRSTKEALDSGWVVSVANDLITCSPSIAAAGYHGHLQNGRFTADCDRTGKDGRPLAPNGVRRS